MKKSLFLALAAIVAFAVTSCKVELPKAVFSYEVNELTVTFTNMSKNADSYLWNFGDGQTATETNPVHTYAQNGEYTVTLTATNKGGNNVFTETLQMSAPLLKVDGKFEDWQALIDKKYGGLSNFINDPEKEWDTQGLKKIYYATDADFLYFFMYYKDETDNKNNSFAFYIDADGDPSTGKSRSGYWANIGAEYEIEFGDASGAESPAVSEEDEWNDWTVFNVIILPDGDQIEYRDQAVVKGTIGELQVVEGSIPMPYITGNGTLSNSSRVGCRSCLPDWNKAGGLPAIYLIEGNQVTQDAPALAFVQ